MVIERQQSYLHIGKSAAKHSVKEEKALYRVLLFGFVPAIDNKAYLEPEFKISFDNIGEF